MLIPIIRVKDGLSGLEHIVGTKESDKLIICDNSIHYSNYLNGSGTNVGGYKFVGETNNNGSELSIEFVTIDELAEIISAQNQFDSEQIKKIIELKKDLIREEEREREERDEAILLTSVG